METGEKPAIPQSSPSTSTSSSFFSSLSLPSFDFTNFVPQPFRQTFQHLSDWRDRLGLENPGTIEGLHKEVQRDVFLTNFAFSGMKADLGKSFSANPLFQVQHSFSAGSSQIAPWSFLSMFATDNVFLSRIIIDNRFSCREQWIMNYSLWGDVILLLIHKMLLKL
jgi:Eukaryotic porin